VRAGLEFFGHAFESHNGRHLKGTGHDARVRGLASNVGGKAQNHLPIHDRQFGRRQILADNDARLRQFLEVRVSAVAHEIVQDAQRDIANIRRPLAQISVIKSAQSRHIFVGKFLEGGLDVYFPGVNGGMDRFDQHRVFEHQQVGVEDAGFLRVEGVADFMLYFNDLLPGQQQGLFETLHLRGQFGFRDIVFGDFSLGLVEHVDLALANAGRNRDPFVNALSCLRLVRHKE
jgi:hypothetical protein